MEADENLKSNRMFTNLGKIKGLKPALMVAINVDCVFSKNRHFNSMPIHVLQYVIHAQKRPCTHLSFGAYVQKRRVILCMHNQ